MTRHSGHFRLFVPEIPNATEQAINDIDDYMEEQGGLILGSDQPQIIEPTSTPETENQTVPTDQDENNDNQQNDTERNQEEKENLMEKEQNTTQNSEEEKVSTENYKLNPKRANKFFFRSFNAYHEQRIFWQISQKINLEKETVSNHSSRLFSVH